MGNKYKLVENIGYALSILSGLMIIWRSGLTLLSSFLAVLGILFVLEAKSRAKKAADKIEEK